MHLMVDYRILLNSKLIIYKYFLLYFTKLADGHDYINFRYITTLQKTVTFTSDFSPAFQYSDNNLPPKLILGCKYNVCVYMPLIKQFCCCSCTLTVYKIKYNKTTEIGHPQNPYTNVGGYFHNGGNISLRPYSYTGTLVFRIPVLRVYGYK